MTPSNIIILVPVSCFNPYYVGYCTMTFSSLLELISKEFQSLLCWILYYDTF